MSKHEPEMLSESTRPPEQTEAVGEYVLRGLGRPANLIAVQVRHLWEDHYRVNVLVGDDVTSVTIAHSYFLVMGSDGSCLSCQPVIVREYARKQAAAAPLS